MQNKQQYLSYFSNSKLIKKNCNSPKQNQKVRPKSSQYHLTQFQKLLPHITQQYQYKITNQLLQHKINHPRRDKTIMESVNSNEKKREDFSRKKQRTKTKGRNHQNEEFTQSKQFKTNDSMKGQNIQLVEGNKFKWQTKRNKIERLYKTFGESNSPCNNYMNDYLITLENNRMGKRLINTRSMVQDILTKNYYTYQIYNGKLVNRDKFMKINRNSIKFRSCNKSFGKINNGIKSFFHNVVNNSKKHKSQHHNERSRQEYQDKMSKTILIQNTNRKTQHQESKLNHHGHETNIPCILQTYGEGDYTFIINRIILQNNPPIKPQAMLAVQIIEGQAELSDILQGQYAQKNNFFKYHCKTQGNQQRNKYISASFPYEYISSQSKHNFGIKFRVHKQKYLYLRLLKYQGINQRELGVIKLNLENYYYKKPCQFQFVILKEYRQIDGILQQRRIMQSYYQGNLAKIKKGTISTEIHLEYHYYQRNFTETDPQEQITHAGHHFTEYELGIQSYE